MEDKYNFSELLEQTPGLEPLTNLITEVMSLPEESLNDDTVEVITKMVISSLDESTKNESVKSVMRGFEDAQFSKQMARNSIETTKSEINSFIDSLSPSKYKHQIINQIFDLFYEIFDLAVEQYHNFSIELPIKLDEGAQMPIYAHESDACADLSALEETTIPAHSFGNKVKTGVHLQLPEGWQARALPRSSIGAKTPLRMSNSCAVIDTAYTGDVTILFDNISDSDYTINAGDRIAQLWIEPIYRFKAIQVDELQETERNDAGFGSTGK